MRGESQHTLVTVDGQTLTGDAAARYLAAPPPPPPAVDEARQRVARARAREDGWHRAARAVGDELVVGTRPGDQPEHQLRLAKLRRALGEQPS